MICFYLCVCVYSMLHVEARRVQNHRTVSKQVPHQIPINSREGGNQTHKTTAKDVWDVELRLEPEACGLVGVGVCFSAQTRAEQCKFVYTTAASSPFFFSLHDSQITSSSFFSDRDNSCSSFLHPWFLQLCWGTQQVNHGCQPQTLLQVLHPNTLQALKPTRPHLHPRLLLTFFSQSHVYVPQKQKQSVQDDRFLHEPHLPNN